MSAQDNLKLWETHITGEFMTKDTDLSLSTMVEDASDGRRAAPSAAAPPRGAATVGSVGAP